MIAVALFLPVWVAAGGRRLGFAGWGPGFLGAFCSSRDMASRSRLGFEQPCENLRKKRKLLERDYRI